MRLGWVDTNGLPLREARHADHHGRKRKVDLIMHSDMHDAPRVKILADHRGNGEMMHLIMDLDSTDARLAKIPMSDLPTDDLTLGLVARHVGAVVGFGESIVGMANHSPRMDHLHYSVVITS